MLFYYFLIFLIFVILLLVFFLYSIRNVNENNKEIYEWNNCKLTDQKKIANTWNKYGVIIIPNVVSNEHCNELLNIIKEEETNSKYKETNNVRSVHKREDLFLPLEKCRPYIKNIYEKIKIFVDTIAYNSKFMDCSSLNSKPGSYPQEWHSDTNVDKTNKLHELLYSNLFSISVSLQDVDETMGPLEAYLGTHRINYDYINYINEKYNIPGKFDEEDNDMDCKYYKDNIKSGLCDNKIAKILEIENIKPVKAVCKKGSIVIWSSKLFHRGGGNYGNKDRYTFYFTLIGIGKLNPMNYEPSIKKNDKNKIIYMKDL